MGKKGLSLEEKRAGMLEIFTESQDFYQLKELEKIAPKSKGIIQQSVKEVLQSLVDDGMVDAEKIGTSWYYWAFPSKSVSTRKRKLDETNAAIQTLKQSRAEYTEHIKTLMAGREDGAERTALDKKLAELQAEEAQVDSELITYRDNDPEVLKDLAARIDLAKTAANRWTDNIFNFKSYATKNFAMQPSDFHTNFQVPEDIDYLE